jgi:hypothetical protein
MQAGQNADDLEHFCTLGSFPTVDRSQQTAMVDSFPHCSQVFRTIHTHRFRNCPIWAGMGTSMIGRIRKSNAGRRANLRHSSQLVLQRFANWKVTFGG